MDLQQLRVFRAAAEVSSFTRASETLDLSQSTVSQHIKQLEDELGCSLFLRAGKRVYLSEAGKILKHYAEKVLTELKNAELSIRELSEIKRGTIKFGVGAATLTYQLPGILGEYRRRYPQIELIVTTGTTETLLELVASQALDLAIVMDVQKSSGNLQMTPLQPEELVVIVNAEHALARKSLLDAKDLLTLPFILYEDHTIMQKTIQAYFRAMDVKPEIIMELENIEAIKSLVSAGLGASIIPFCSVTKSYENPLLRVLRVREHSMERRLALATLNAELLPVAIEKFAAQIIRNLPPLPLRTLSEPR